jgi:hypothetical protein
MVMSALPFSVKAQNAIDSIQTNKEVREFVIKHFPKLKDQLDYDFDSAVQIGPDSLEFFLKFRKWDKADFNGDHLTDLLFTSKTGFGDHNLYVILSNSSGYVLYTLNNEISFARLFPRLVYENNIPVIVLTSMFSYDKKAPLLRFASDSSFYSFNTYFYLKKDTFRYSNGTFTSFSTNDLSHSFEMEFCIHYYGTESFERASYLQIKSNGKAFYYGNRNDEMPGLYKGEVQLYLLDSLRQVMENIPQHDTLIDISKSGDIDRTQTFIRYDNGKSIYMRDNREEARGTTRDFYDFMDRLRRKIIWKEL